MDKNNDCGCRIDHPIKGIKCDVKNCVYHKDDYTCNAGEIAVGPSFATDCGDTACRTFEQKKDSTVGLLTLKQFPAPWGSGGAYKESTQDTYDFLI